MVHRLKTLPEYYIPIIESRKPFEVRYNDRDFKKDDTLILREWDGEKYTGRYTTGIIKDVFNIDFIKKDYVAFTFMLLDSF